MKKIRNQVLVLVPGNSARGGVTNYYISLRKHLPENVIYLERGARKFPYNKNLISEIFRMIKDYSLFVWYLLSKNISIVHTNTSLDKKGVIRDVVYLFIAKLFRKKTIVFYRGWDDDFANEISVKMPFWYKPYLRVHVSIVLATSFKVILNGMGHKGNIYIETTTVNTDLLENKFSKPETLNIVFLARVEKEKGVFILLDAYKSLLSKYNNLKLQIAGDGKALEELSERIKNESVPNVELLGFIDGNNKAKLLSEASIFVFPTYYKEGMPNSILEAFAFGLPVVTRPVAGLVDVFTDQVNGFLIPSTESEDFAEKMDLLLSKEDLRLKISENNIKHADKFLSVNVAKRLLTIYEDVLKII